MIRISQRIQFCLLSCSKLTKGTKFRVINIQKMSSSPPELIPITQPAVNQPLDGLLLNKIDTQQESFLGKHPTYDGRDILIAILDTGVDPSLPGMLVTTTGERKMVDVIDCSGAGDVETTTIRTVKDGIIEGLSGRKLNIPEKWTCPTGKYHVGIKPIYELYTKGVKSKIQAEKNEEIFAPSHNLSIAEALKKMTEHETEIGGNSEKTSDKWERENLACKIDFLKSMQNTTDVGPVADVITWHDGDIWRVCIDTSFRGRLGICNVLGSFKETGEYAYLTEKDSVVYTVRVSNDGNLVEIAVPSGAHGSHVAGIAAANYPDQPAKNGLAPGAKIVSLNIGDHRLAAMETGQAMTRAFNICAEMGVDVINMSFGEGTHFPDVGRVIEEARRLIDRKNVIYVCSAGNAGPALSTVGAPGGTTTNIIGIGAYLTSESADTLYGVFNDVDSNIYPWSSRGPCPNGQLGVSVCAPAAAFANVPQYCRQSMQMMNGTSMSSPNAAGNVACMLSGLKQQNLSNWTPYTVKLAVENTAQELPQTDAFSSGRGMLKIDAAFDKLSELLRLKTFPERLTHFEIEVANYCQKSKGIYIREPCLTRVQEFTVTVEPKFQNYLNHDNQSAINFERQLILQSNNTPWLSHPSTMFAVAQKSSLVVTVDASKAPNGANFSEIVAIDAANPTIGPIFRIPVTVIVPEVCVEAQKGTESKRNVFTTKLVGKSGQPERRFVKCPEWATSARITLASTNKNEMDRFTLHTVYLEDDKCSRNTETSKMHGPTGNEWSKCIKVKGGKTLEACVVRNWSRGKTPVDVEMRIEFFGITKPDNVHIIHGATSTPIRIRASPQTSTQIAPTISLNSMMMTLKPQSSKIEPLGARDVFVTSGLQIHRALITYKLNVTKSSEIRLEMAGVTDYLYESPYDCVLFQIFGANKWFVGASGSFPDRYTHKLEKGDYVIQAQIRHPDDQLLEKIKEIPLMVHLKLGSKINVDLALSAEGASHGKWEKFANKGLLAGQEMTVYAGNVPEDKLPKTITSTTPGGALLTGSFSALKDSELAAVDKVPVIYYLTMNDSTSGSSKSSKNALSMVTSKKEKLSESDEMKEAIRDVEVGWIGKLTDDKLSKEMFDACVEKYPNHLPAYLNRIKRIMQTQLKASTDVELYREAIQMSAKILDLTNPTEVLQFMAIKQEHSDDLLTIDKWMALKNHGSEETTSRKEAAKMIGEFEEKKSAIITALQTLSSLEQDVHLYKSRESLTANLKLGALTPLIFDGKAEIVSASKKSEEYDELSKKMGEVVEIIENELKLIDPKWSGSQNYVKLLVWLSADDSKAALISVKHAAALGQFGRCAKLLLKIGDELKSSGKESKIIDSTLAETCDQLGWVHLSNHFKNEMLIKNRPTFRLF